MGKQERRLFGLLKDRKVTPGSWSDSLTKHQTWLRTILVFGLLLFGLACILSAIGVGFGAASPRH